MSVPSPLETNEFGTFDEFVRSVELRPDVAWREGLIQVPYNEDIEARVAILNWMLDQGVDVAKAHGRDRVNVLHTFFTSDEHDFELEAPVLQRLLDAGADLNLRSPRFSVPIRSMLTNMTFEDSELEVIYDVIFSHPGIDWDLIAGESPDGPESVRAYVEAMEGPFPELNRRMREYIENGPSSRPVFE